MTAPILQIVPSHPATTCTGNPEDLCFYPGPCADNLHLRQDYMDALSEFNAAAKAHNVVLKTGLQGAAFETSWRKLRERSADSHAAWSRYRTHVAAHGCKRG